MHCCSGKDIDHLWNHMKTPQQKKCNEKTLKYLLWITYFNRFRTSYWLYASIFQYQTSTNFRLLYDSCWVAITYQLDIL